MKISLGRIVHYVLTSNDAAWINGRRDPFRERAVVANGTQYHYGNHAAGGDIFPMIVTRIWPGATGVNGQVLLDGNDVQWVTSAKEDTETDPAKYTLGTWHWPPCVEGAPFFEEI